VEPLIFESGELALRRMNDAAEDYALLSGWLSDPRVLEWYEGRDHPFSVEEVLEKYGPRAQAEEAVIPCFMLRGGKPVGYLQFYPADPVEYHFEGAGSTWAIDLFLAEPEIWGQGLGTRFVRLVLEHLFTHRGADWVLIDPHVRNHRAVRCYEKAGFRKVKVLPAHEVHEGHPVDSWLMAAGANRDILVGDTSLSDVSPTRKN
jgi:aminoglycoside 6'-N-acetyltransferase